MDSASPNRTLEELKLDTNFQPPNIWFAPNRTLEELKLENAGNINVKGKISQSHLRGIETYWTHRSYRQPPRPPNRTLEELKPMMKRLDVM